MKRILLIEDDEIIAEAEKDFIEACGYSVDIEQSGDTGLQKALEDEYDMIILDLMLPGLDGFEICRRIRLSKKIPILMVSSRKEEIDKIRGLGLGADDYITKPFGVGELVARVKAHLARYDRLTEQDTHKKEEIRFGTIRIDTRSRRVFVDGSEVQLTSKEYDLLLFFAGHPNHVFSKNDLFERVWGIDAIGDNATVAVHIGKLREKIEMEPARPQYIETIWGVGYRLNV